MVVLSYLGPLAVIPLLTEKNDPDILWHAKHGLVLFVSLIVGIFAFNALTWVLPAEVSCLFGCFPWFALTTAYLVVIILAISKGLKRQRFIIPGLSDLVSRF